MHNPFKEAKLTDDEVLYVGLNGAGPVSMASAERADCAEALGGTFQKEFYRDASGNEYFYNADSGQSEEDWLKEKQQAGVTLTKAGENERASNYIYQHKMYDLSDGRRVFVREDEEEAFQKKAQTEGWAPKAVVTRRWNGVDFTGDLKQLLGLQQKYAKNGVFDDGTLMAMGATEDQVIQGKLSQQDKINKILEQYKGQGKIGFIENEAKTRGLGSIGREAENFWDALHMYGTEAADAVTLDSYWTLGEMASQLGGEDGLEKIKDMGFGGWTRASLWGGLSVWEAITMSDEDLHARLKEIREDQELWNYIQSVRGLSTGARIGSGVVDMAKMGIEFASSAALASAAIAATTVTGGATAGAAVAAFAAAAKTAKVAHTALSFGAYATGKFADAYAGQTADRMFFNPVTGQMEKIAEGRQGLEAATYAAGGIVSDYVIEKVGGKLAMKAVKPIAAPVKSVAKKALGKNMATVMGIAPGVVTNSKALGRLGGMAKRMGNAYHKLTAQPWGQVIKSGIEGATPAGCIEELMEEGLQAAVEGRLNISGEVDMAKGEIAEGSWKAAGEGIVDLVKHAPEFAATLLLYNVGAGPASRGINTLVNAYSSEAAMKHALRWSGHSAEEIKAMSRSQMRETFKREYMTGNAEVGEAIRQEMLNTHGTADGMMAELGRFGFPQNAVVSKNDAGEYTITLSLGDVTTEIKGENAVREWAAKELGKKAAKFGRGAFLAEKQMAVVGNAIMFMNREEIHNVTRLLRETGAFDNFEVFGNSAEAVESMREALAFRYMAESRMYSGTPVGFLFNAASQNMMNQIEKQSKENGDTLFKEFHRFSNGISLEGEPSTESGAKKLFPEGSLSSSGNVDGNGNITWDNNGVFVSKDAKGFYSVKVDTPAIRTPERAFATEAEALAYANELGAKKAAADARHEHWRKTAEEIYDKLYNAEGSANRNMLVLHNAYENDAILSNVREIYEKSQYANTMSFERFLSLNTALRIPNGGIVLFTDNINSLTRLASAIRHEGMHTGLANLYNLDQGGAHAAEFMKRVLPLFKQGGGKYILRDAGGHEITLKKYEAASDSDKAVILDEAMAYLCEMMTKEPELSDTIIDTVGSLFGKGDVNWKNLTARQRARETRALISEAFSRVHDPNRALAMQSWHRVGTTNVRASTPTYGLRIAELIAKNAPKDDSLEAEAEAEAKVASETPAVAVKAVEDSIAEHQEDLNGQPVEEAEAKPEEKSEEPKQEEPKTETPPETSEESKLAEEAVKEEPKPFDLTPYLERKTKRQRDYEQRLAEKTIDLIGKGGEKLATFEAALLKELHNAQALLLTLVPDGIITGKPKAVVIELYQKIAALGDALEVLEKNRIITENRDAEAKHKIQLEADTIYTIKDILDDIRNNKDASRPLFEQKDMRVLKAAIEENLAAAREAGDEYAVEVMQEALALLDAKPDIVDNLIENNIAEAARAFEEAKRERQRVVNNAMDLVQQYVDEEFANTDEGYRLSLGQLKGFAHEEVKAIKPRPDKEIARGIVNSLYNFFESELEKQFVSGEIANDTLWDSDNEYANALAYVRDYADELEAFVENYIQLKKVKAFAATRKAQAESSESGEARLNEDLAAFETLGSATVDTFEMEVEQGVLNSPRAIAEYTALMNKKLSQFKKKLVEPKQPVSEKPPTRQQRSEESRRKHEEANAKRQEELKAQRQQREQERKRQKEEQKKIEEQNRLWRNIFKGLVAFGSALGKKLESGTATVATEEKSPAPTGKNIVAPITPEVVKETEKKADAAKGNAVAIVEEGGNNVKSLKDELNKHWEGAEGAGKFTKKFGALSEEESFSLVLYKLIENAYGNAYCEMSDGDYNSLLLKAGFTSANAARKEFDKFYKAWTSSPEIKNLLPKKAKGATISADMLNTHANNLLSIVNAVLSASDIISTDGDVSVEDALKAIEGGRAGAYRFYSDLKLKIEGLSSADSAILAKYLSAPTTFGKNGRAADTVQDQDNEVLHAFKLSTAVLGSQIDRKSQKKRVNYDDLSPAAQDRVFTAALDFATLEDIGREKGALVPTAKDDIAEFSEALQACGYQTLFNSCGRKFMYLDEEKNIVKPGKFTGAAFSHHRPKLIEKYGSKSSKKDGSKEKEIHNASDVRRVLANIAMSLMSSDPRFSQLKDELAGIERIVRDSYSTAYTKGSNSLRSAGHSVGNTIKDLKALKALNEARAQIIGEFGATPEELAELEKAKKLITRMLGKSAEYSKTQTEYDDLEDFRKNDLEGFCRFIHDVNLELQPRLGWFIGFDGRWRLEVEDVRTIDDIPGLSDMFYYVYNTGTSPGGYTIREFLANRSNKNEAKPLADLVKRYPLLAEVEIEITPYKNDGNLGETEPGMLNAKRTRWVSGQAPKIGITVDRNAGQFHAELDTTYTFLHEIQHVIQKIEGFVGGSNPDYMGSFLEMMVNVEKGYAQKPDAYDLADFGFKTYEDALAHYKWLKGSNDEINRYLTHEESSPGPSFAQRGSVLQNVANALYAMVYGEYEARTVSARARGRITGALSGYGKGASIPFNVGGPSGTSHYPVSMPSPLDLTNLPGGTSFSTSPRAQIIGEIGATEEELALLAPAKEMMLKLFDEYQNSLGDKVRRFNTVREFRIKDPEGFFKFLGRTNALVSRQFGWFLGNDGKWKLEIEDIRNFAFYELERRPYFYDNVFESVFYYSDFAGGTLEDFTDPESIERNRATADPIKNLIKRYPALRNVGVVFEPRSEGGALGTTSNARYIRSKGQFANDPTITLYVDRNNPEGIEAERARVGRTFLHELQHVIQKIEGFAPGGSDSVVAQAIALALAIKRASTQGYTPEEKDLGFGEQHRNLYTAMGFYEASDVLKYYEHLKRSLGKHNMELFDKLEEGYNRMTKLNLADLLGLSDAMDLAKKHGMDGIDLVDSLSNIAWNAYFNIGGEVEARTVANRDAMRASGELSGYGKDASAPIHFVKDSYSPETGELPNGAYPIQSVLHWTSSTMLDNLSGGVEADITWADGTTARAQVIGQEGATVGELKLLRKAIKMLDSAFDQSEYSSSFKNMNEFARARRTAETPADQAAWYGKYYDFLNETDGADDSRSLNMKIYDATGWYMGPEGLWRREAPNVPKLAEISEVREAINKNIADKDLALSWTLGELAKLDTSGRLKSLLRRYKALRDVPVIVGHLNGSQGVAWPGNYSRRYRKWVGGLPFIEIDAKKVLKEKSGESVFAHEVQHVIQDVEKFATGGDGASISKTWKDGLTRAEQTDGDKRLYRFLVESNPDVFKALGGDNPLPKRKLNKALRRAEYAWWASLYGEQEATAVELREGEAEANPPMPEYLDAHHRGQLFPGDESMFAGDIYEGISDLVTTADRDAEPVKVSFRPLVLDNIQTGKGRQHYLAQLMSEDDIEMGAYNARVAETAEAVRASEGLGAVGNAAYDRLVNYLGPLLRAYRAVSKGKQVADSENVEAAMKNVHGKIRTKADDLHRKYIKPLIEIIKDNDLDADRLDDYLYAKFAPERNKMIQARTLVVDPDTGDLITMDEAGSGMSAEESERLLKRLDGEKNRAAYLKAMHLVWSMNGEVAQMYVDYGFATAAQQETWRKLSPHYVPLKDLESPSFSLKKRSGALGGLLHRAKGRTTRAASPLAASIAQANGVITKGELSNANKTLARFVQKYDADGAQMGGRVAAFTGIARSIREGKAMFVPDGSNAEAIITEYNNLPEVKSSGQTVDLIVTEESAKLGGKIVSRADGIPEKLRVSLVKSKASTPNVVEYFEDGIRKFIVFDKDNADSMSIAEAANRSKLITQSTAGSLQGAWGVAQKLTRWKADVSTSLNPRFILRNMGADFFNTAMIMMTEGKWGALGSFAKNYRKAVKSVRDFAKGKDVSKTDVGKYYMEARENGMLTGVFAEGSFKAAAHKLSRDLKRLKGNDLRKGWEAFKDFMETIGSYPEQGARLAAYIAVRESGMTPAQAAQYGREITVDFNAKGQWTPILNTLYMFSNAGAQGIARAAKALQVGAEARGGGTQGYVRAALPGILVSTALGFISAALMDMSGDGDDEDDVNTSKWARLPEYVKANNLTVPFIGDTYIQLPTRGAWQSFTHFGGLLYDYASGTKDGADVVAGFTESVRDSVDFIGGNAPTGWQWLAPTIADPIVQVLEGKDWTGRDLYRRDYGQQQADSDQGKNSTGSIYKGIAKGLNYITGGDEVKGGLIDVYPETFKVFTEFMVGSLAQIALSDIPNTVQTIVGEREASASDIPVLGGVLRQSTGVDSLYYKHYNEYNEVAETVSAYRKRRKAAKTREEREEWLGKERKLIKEHPWAKSVDGLRKLTTRINELRTKIANGAPNREQLEAQIEELQKRFIRFIQ